MCVKSHTFKNVLYEYYKENTIPYILVPVIYCEFTVRRCCIYRYRGPVIYYELTVRRCCIYQYQEPVISS